MSPFPARLRRVHLVVADMSDTVNVSDRLSFSHPIPWENGPMHGAKRESTHESGLNQLFEPRENERFPLKWRTHTLRA